MYDQSRPITNSFANEIKDGLLNVTFEIEKE